MKRGTVFVIIAIGILILGLLAVQFLKKSPGPQFVQGEEILEVTVTMDNGVPLEKIEIDLWLIGSVGPPDAGYNFTDKEGKTSFHIPDGDYEIGFNLNNFPENLVYPEKTPVSVEKGILASKTILIKAKQE